jgi:hypothetical protein
MTTDNAITWEAGQVPLEILAKLCDGHRELIRVRRALTKAENEITALLASVKEAVKR